MRLPFFFSVLALICACMLLPANTCIAAPVPGITDEQLAATEHKLLQRTYEHDPLSKRLQRLELFIFGATQYGSNEQRWHNINHYLSNNNTSKNNISSSLNELEKYVFKKTTPAESTSKRLAKLETKLFGQPSPAMPTANRIARLQRTLGLAATPGDTANVPPSMRGMPDMMMPGFGFGNNFGFGDNGMGDMSQLFREMEQMQEQMQQMQPHGFDQQSPGFEEHHFYMYSTPDGGFKIGPEPDPNFNPKHQKPNGGKGVKPNPPALPAPQLIPQPNSPEERVPSYADPNFI